MTGGQARLPPAVARARLLVRRSLADLSPGDLVLVGLSGGADSLALAAAIGFVAPRAGLRWGAVVVDHRLQPGSERVAAEAADQARKLGADLVRVERVDATGAGRLGPEGSAREARLDALRRAATETPAAAVLLAHTRDDQAETVLLGLARGSGPRSLAGMASRTGLVRRPLLDLTRAEARQVCAAAGLTPWTDPHNADPAYARSRVRTEVLPVLEKQLGPGVADALARTADLLRADADLLDRLADELFAAVAVPGEPGALDVAALATAPAALRRRVLRSAALAAGAPATDLTAGHVAELDRLVTDWHGQVGVDLPGRLRASLDGGVLRVAAAVAR